MHDTTELPGLADSTLGRPGMSAADRSRWTGAMMLSVFTIVKPAAEDGWPAGR
jgi:hypothetical protein